MIVNLALLPIHFTTLWSACPQSKRSLGLPLCNGPHSLAQVLVYHSHRHCMRRDTGEGVAILQKRISPLPSLVLLQQPKVSIHFLVSLCVFIPDCPAGNVHLHSAFRPFVSKSLLCDANYQPRHLLSLLRTPLTFVHPMV